MRAPSPCALSSRYIDSMRNRVEVPDFPSWFHRVPGGWKPPGRSSRIVKDGELTEREAVKMRLSDMATAWGAADPALIVDNDLHGLAVLSTLLDEVIAEEVTHARESGASWSEVGRALGMSRQAAQQRFGV